MLVVIYCTTNNTVFFFETDYDDFQCQYSLEAYKGLARLPALPFWLKLPLVGSPRFYFIFVIKATNGVIVIIKGGPSKLFFGKKLSIWPNKGGEGSNRSPSFC